MRKREMRRKGEMRKRRTEKGYMVRPINKMMNYFSIVKISKINVIC